MKQINTQGQISVGKFFAGQQVQVEKYPDGAVFLIPVEVIGTFELNLMKEQMFNKRHVAFNQWESSKRPVESNLEQLDKSGEA